MDWYLKALKNYVGFSGRARRKEYWIFTLINFGIYMILQAIIGAVAVNDPSSPLVMIFGAMYLVYALGVMLPSIAVSIRRMHDINKSGWTLLLGLIPIVGAILLLVYSFTEGTAGPNRFGEDPKMEDEAEALLEA